MKKIGLLSDTHNYLDERIFTYFKDCDEIWHAGDIGNPEILTALCEFKPTRAVWGNIDGSDVRKMCHKEQRFEVDGLKVWIIHIGGYPPSYTPEIRKKLDIINPDLFICGHSHILKIIGDPKRNLLHINPGAAGRYGMHKVKTLIRFSVEKGKIQEVEVIELDKPKA